MYFTIAQIQGILYLNHKYKVNTRSTQYHLADTNNSMATVNNQAPKTTLKVKLCMEKSH